MRAHFISFNVMITFIYLLIAFLISCLLMTANLYILPCMTKFPLTHTRGVLFELFIPDTVMWECNRIFAEVLCILFVVWQLCMSTSLLMLMLSRLWRNRASCGIQILLILAVLIFVGIHVKVSAKRNALCGQYDTYIYMIYSYEKYRFC